MPKLPPGIDRPVLPAVGDRWLDQFQGQAPVYVCVLGFTKTAAIPGISAAGATPTDRQFTAVADAEFLYDGPTAHPTYSLPPLVAGVSPALIARAVIAGQQLPLYLFDAGLPHPPSVPHISLGGQPADCVSSGQALPIPVVQHLFETGLRWGQRLGERFAGRYLILSECVVAGTTTAQALLTGLGYPALGKVNSSHPHCNHDQKQNVVHSGLQRWQALGDTTPLALVAAIGDPMQITVAGMALGASPQSGVLLAGGSQMMAVYALIQALVKQSSADQNVLSQNAVNLNAASQSAISQNIVVGTTRWVLEDASSDTLGLADLIQVPLLSTQLSFADSKFEQLRRFEQGYVKEGVGAGGCAIAAQLYQGWPLSKLVTATEQLVERCLQRAMG
ncbi:MAG: nicotinate mononucleotide-dependent phosphoribosyltransferase CobT [Cyanobacteria bacterium P01_A01_bin.105]